MLEVQRSIRIDVELWIDKRDSIILQLKLDIESPVTGSGGKLLGTSAISTFIRYFSFNQTIEIGPPLTPSGGLDLGWQTSTGRPPQPTVETSDR